MFNTLPRPIRGGISLLALCRPIREDISLWASHWPIREDISLLVSHWPIRKDISLLKLRRPIREDISLLAVTLTNQRGHFSVGVTPTNQRGHFSVGGYIDQSETLKKTDKYPCCYACLIRLSLLSNKLGHSRSVIYHQVGPAVINPVSCFLYAVQLPGSWSKSISLTSMPCCLARIIAAGLPN